MPVQVYEELNAAGKFQEKLLEMYRWGKANGWDSSPAQQAPTNDRAPEYSGGTL